MRRLLTFDGSSGRRRKSIACALIVVAVAGSLRSSAAGESSSAPAAAGADLMAAHAAAVANARSIGTRHMPSGRVRQDTSVVTRHGLPDTSRPAAPAAHDRSADHSHSAALFAAHSWYVAPPPPPPAPPPPPVAPSAPPFPYTFVGAFTSQGDGTVYFLAQGDRVIDAHVGDHLDGVYQFESATAGQLTFNYLPLNIRQLLSTGAPQ